MTDTTTPPWTARPHPKLAPGFYVAWRDGSRPGLVEYAPQYPNAWRSQLDDAIADPRDYGYTLTPVAKP